MFQDKNPIKYIILGLLFLIVLFGIVLFFGMQAKAAQKFIAIEEITSPLGIKIWTIKDNSLPIIAVQFAFMDAGTANDPKTLQGLSRMLSNTLDEGAGELDSQNFQKFLSDHSISLGFSADRDTFGGELQMLSRHQDKAYELLSLALNKPTFADDAVTRMRDGNIARIKSSLSEPEWMISRIINDRAFEGHDYAKNSGGTLSQLQNIKPDDLRAFKKDFLTKDRLVIAAGGDIDPIKLGAAVDKIFGSLPDTSSKEPLKNIVISNAGESYLYEQDIPQTFIEIMMPTFDNIDPDHYALQVLNYILGGAGFGSRLMDTAREKGGLTYGIYSGLHDFRHGDFLSISTSTKNESAKEMFDIIKSEMQKLVDAPVSPQELQEAKSYIIGSMPLALTSTDKIVGVALSLRAENLPIDYLDHYKERIDAVRAEDIERVAKRILKPENMVTVMVGKPVNIENIEIVKELPNVQ